MFGFGFFMTFLAVPDLNYKPVVNSAKVGQKGQFVSFLPSLNLIIQPLQKFVKGLVKLGRFLKVYHMGDPFKNLLLCSSNCPLLFRTWYKLDFVQINRFLTIELAYAPELKLVTFWATKSCKSTKGTNTFEAIGRF
jgi:hypothetical protein